jgi:hypothetical protein
MVRAASKLNNQLKDHRRSKARLLEQLAAITGAKAP